MAATFSFEDAVETPKAGPATFSFDEAVGTPQRELPSGVKPSTAGGGRGSAADPRRLDKPTTEPVYEPMSGVAIGERDIIETDGRATDDKRTRSTGRVTDKTIPGMTPASLAQDAASGALQIGPTVVKGVGDIARLATGDRIGKGLTDFAERGNKAIQEVVGSERGAMQRKQFEQDMQDPALNAADVIVGNPGALADMALPTIGSMALPVAAAGVATKLATGSRAAQLAGAIDPAMLAARANTAREVAVLGTTIAQNAASGYSESRDAGLPQDQSYMRAAITAPFTYVAGRLTGGGAEGQVARALIGKQSATGAVKAGAQGALKEAAQEGGESVGDYVGETVGKGEEFDLNKASKQVAVGATLGAVIGGGSGAVSAASVAREARIKQLRDAGETGVADLLQTKHDKQSAIESVDSELAAMPGNPEFQNAYRNMRTAGLKPAEAAGRSAVTVTFQGLAAQTGIPTKAADAALQKASTLPIDQVPGFFAKYTQALAARGLVQSFDGIDQLAGSLETARDEAIDAAMGAAYSQGDVRKSMDDVLALEKNSAPGADLPEASIPEGQRNPTTRGMDIARKLTADIDQAAPESERARMFTIEAQRIRDTVERVQATPDIAEAYAHAADVLDEQARFYSQQPQGINEATTTETTAPDAVPESLAAGNESQSLGDSALLATGSTEPGQEALNGVLRDTNPQAGTAAQTETAPGQAAEVAAVDEAGITPAGDAAGASALQTNGIAVATQRQAAINNVVTPVELTAAEKLRKAQIDRDYSHIPEGNRPSPTIYGEGKQPWEMDASEFSKQRNGNPYFDQSYTGQDDGAYLRDAFAAHAQVVKQAAAAGKPVPQEAIEQIAPPAENKVGRKDSAQLAQPDSVVQTGRNNIPLTEGGKPFKTKVAADTARKGQTMMRTVRVEGGFVLTEKSTAQIKAQDRAAQRLSNPQTSPAGEAIPAHAFIASEGGLSPFERADMGMDGNVNIGNRKLFAGTGKGLTIERALEKLVEDGYLPEGAGHDQARSLIKRSLTNPQYTPEGTEFMAEKEAAQREADYYAEQEAIALLEEAHDNDMADAADAFEAAALGLPESVTQSEMALDDAMRVAGFTEEEIQHATANQPGSPQAGSNADAGTAETATGTRPQGDSGRAPAKGEDSSRRGEEVNGNRSASSGSTGESARRESAGDAGKAADRTADATQPGVRGSTDELRPAPQSGPTAAPAVTSTSEITYTLRDSGSLAVKGNPQAIRDKLKGITKIASMEGGMMVGKTQAQRAIDILTDKPAEAPAARPLSVGITPATAEAVTVKDGKVFIGSNEAVNFDSGDAVSVKPNASDAEIVRALKDAGALSRRQKVFGLQDAAQNQSAAQENSDKPAPDALKSAPEPEAKPERNEALIELRKRVSVLKAFIKCMGG